MRKVLFFIFKIKNKHLKTILFIIKTREHPWLCTCNNDNVTILVAVAVVVLIILLSFTPFFKSLDCFREVFILFLRVSFRFSLELSGSLSENLRALRINKFTQN